MISSVDTHQHNFGRGPRRVLALHCTLAHGGAWRGVAERLDAQASFVAIDAPQHGKSRDWDRNSDFHDACTAAALPSLNPETDLVGHSFGATVALRLALQHPERVRSLTLVETVLFAAARSGAPDILARHLEDARPYRDELVAADPELAARRFNRAWGDGRPWADFPASTRKYMVDRIHLVPAQTPSLLNDRSRLLAPERLEGLQVPTLLVEGDQSPDIIAAINQVLSDRLPACRRKIVRGAGHMAPVTHPAEVAEAIFEFLEVT